MLRNSLAFPFLLVIVAILAGGCSTPTDPVDMTYGGNTQPDDGPQVPLVTPGVDVGDEAPDFTLADTYGDDINLAGLRGKPVLLFFWATGCDFCEDEYPRMQDFHETYVDSLTVMSINMGDDSQMINAFMADRDLTYPCLVATGAVQTAYEVTGVPHSILLDAEGIVTFNNHPGYLTEIMLQEEF